MIPLSPLATNLCDALEAVNTMGAAATDVLRTIYHENVVFQDPVQRLCGREQVLAAVARYARGARKLELHVDRSRVSEAPGCIHVPWTSIFVGKVGPTIHCDGVTQLDLSGDHVIFQRDHFDVLGTALAAFPRLVGVYRAVLHRFTSATG